MDPRPIPIPADVEAQWASLVTSLSAHRPSAADASPAIDDPMRAATPVAMLTGFLGAGKSTVLAALLADPGDGRVVRAVVNDIGRLRFDPTLVASDDRTRVELTNGCGCCVAGSAAALGSQLDELADGADLVVLEASGVADPAALAQVIEARPGRRLDRTVAVVDARAVDRLLDVGAAAAVLTRQLDRAQAVILSHTDGLSADDIAAATDRVATLAAGCPVVASTLARPASRVLLPSFPLGAGAPLAAAAIAAPLVTTSFAGRRPVDEEDLLAAIDRAGPGLLRIKGRLLVGGRPTLVQVTPSGSSLSPDRPGPLGVTVVTTDDGATTALADLLGPGQAGGGRPGS